MGEHATPTSTRVPVLVLIDVEPDGFFIGRSENVPWSGFERATEVMADVRGVLAQRTGLDAHFTWLVRADQQVAETYGSAGWAFGHYRRAFETLLAEQDEIGLHVHAYRWEARAGNWIEDYGNQDWIKRCIHAGVGAFEQHFGRPPAAFSTGMDWTNQATIQLVRELNVRYEFSTILRKESQPFPPRDTYSGVAPDCSQIPERPYHPSPDDFCSAAPKGGNGIWLFPQSSRVARIFPSWKRGLWDLVHLRPVAPRWTRKFFLQDNPARLQPAIDEMLRSLERPYLTLAVRTHEFCRADTTATVRRNLEGALDHPDAGRFVFTRPDEALRVLGLADSEQG
jgi:hypothetical protein